MGASTLIPILLAHAPIWTVEFTTLQHSGGVRISASSHHGRNCLIWDRHGHKHIPPVCCRGVQRLQVQYNLHCHPARVLRTGIWFAIEESADVQRRKLGRGCSSRRPGPLALPFDGQSQWPPALSLVYLGIVGMGDPGSSNPASMDIITNFTALEGFKTGEYRSSNIGSNHAHSPYDRLQ